MKFLLEIGTEELPADDVWSAISQLNEKIPHLLKAKGIGGIPKNKIKVYGTPRRLVVYIEDISVNGKKLQELIPILIGSLRFEKSMRWIPGSHLVFSRPIRWIVALLDNKVIKIEFANIVSGRVSFGARFISSPKIKIFSAEEYLDQLKQHRVIVDQGQRKKSIIKQNNRLAKKVGGKTVQEENLLDEVIQLVEYPTCILGRFDKRYLSIPQQVSIMVMKKHQRYFPLVDKQGKLMPYFITVANHLPKNSPLIIQGNEKVVEARLNDGEFFYRQDRQKRLEQFVPSLKTITFHKKLGSVYDKARRLEKTTYKIANLLGVNTGLQNCQRSARLCKADLATSLVREFPSLQGQIGQAYALEDKENKQVAKAIGEHYHPRFSGDKPPQSALGQTLALTDRMDTLCGFFATGIRPMGSKDPYGLRRVAIGIIHILNSAKASVSLPDLFSISMPVLPIKMSQKAQKEAVAFIHRRMEVELKGTGIGDDVIKAVLKGPVAQNVFLSFRLAKKLNVRVKNKQFREFIQAAKRVQNISKDANPKGKIDPKLFKEAEEKTLFKTCKKIDQKVKKAIDNNNIDQLFDIYAGMAGEINRFFDKVMVMSQDKQVRQNRLNLLARISALTKAAFIPAELT